MYAKSLPVDRVSTVWAGRIGKFGLRIRVPNLPSASRLFTTIGELVWNRGKLLPSDKRLLKVGDSNSARKLLGKSVLVSILLTKGGMNQETKREPLRRLSISLPESLCQKFEKLVDRRGYRSRSQAIASMITASLAEYEEPGAGDAVATLVLRYTEQGSSFLLEMAALHRLFRENMVSSSRRLFSNDFTVEVILLQGSKTTLAEIGDQFTTLRGMQSGKLSFV